MVCGNDYTAKAPNSKYCSEMCKLKQYGYEDGRTKFDGIIRKCKLCGKEFQPKCKQHVYCSQRCRQDIRKVGLDVCLIKNKEYFMEKYYFTCSDCKKMFETQDLQIHHIIPLYKGGSNTEDNITVLCQQCHLNAHAKF